MAEQEVENLQVLLLTLMTRYNVYTGEVAQWTNWAPHQPDNQGGSAHFAGIWEYGNM